MLPTESVGVMERRFSRTNAICYKNKKIELRQVGMLQCNISYDSMNVTLYRITWVHRIH
jgi:hypothetical protein